MRIQEVSNYDELDKVLLDISYELDKRGLDFVKVKAFVTIKELLHLDSIIAPKAKMMKMDWHLAKGVWKAPNGITVKFKLK